MITIRCDTPCCGVRSTGPASTISAAQARWGWAHQDGKDICPSCLRGDTPQAQIAELRAAIEQRDALGRSVTAALTLHAPVRAPGLPTLCGPCGVRTPCPTTQALESGTSHPARPSILAGLLPEGTPA